MPSVILEFCDNSFYREDYQAITSYFAADAVPYNEVIGQMRALAIGNLLLPFWNCVPTKNRHINILSFPIFKMQIRQYPLF